MAMTVTAKDLRARAAEVLRAVREGESVELTYRGRPIARIEPIEQRRAPEPGGDEAFGMWSDRTDMEEVREWVRASRGGRLARSSSTRTS